MKISKQQRVIIMEGPDGCGKTEIGTALSSFYDIPYFKVSTEKRNWENHTFIHALRFDQDYISQFLKQTRHSCVIDRAYPSEWVYSKVFVRKTDKEMLEEVDARFAELGAKIVICRRRDYSDVEDELVPNEEMDRIDQYYEWFKEWTRCDVVEIFVDDYHNDLSEQIPFLVKGLK